MVRVSGWENATAAFLKCFFQSLSTELSAKCYILRGHFVMSPDTLTWRWLKSRTFFATVAYFTDLLECQSSTVECYYQVAASLLISVTKNCVITLHADLFLRSFTRHWKDYFNRVMTTGKQMFHQVAKENLPLFFFFFSRQIVFRGRWGKTNTDTPASTPARLPLSMRTCLYGTVLSKLFYFIGGNSKQLQETSCLIILFANLIPQPQKINTNKSIHTVFWSPFLC